MKTLIVAEAGLAHEGSPDYAKRLIDIVADAGADAVKFQVYRTKELIAKDRDPERYGRFKKCELPYTVLPDLRRYAEGKGLLWFATPHTLSALEWLLEMNVSILKIGSGEREDSPILRGAIDSGRQVFISTGLRSHSDILSLVDRYGSERTTFLHCVTMYPAAPQSLNLAFLPTLQRWCRRVGARMGYSDHFEGTKAVEMAVTLGATVIEKHIKIPESTGQDTTCALGHMELIRMVKMIRYTELLLGDKMRHYTDREKESETWALKGKDGKRPRY